MMTVEIPNTSVFDLPQLRGVYLSVPMIYNFEAPNTSAFGLNT